MIKRTLFLSVLLGLFGCNQFQLDLKENVPAIAAPTVTLKNLNEPIGTDTTPEFTISDVEAGDTVEIFTDACITKVGQGVAAGNNVDITSSVLPKGEYQIYTRKITSEGTSVCSSIFAEYQVTGTPMVSVWQTTVPGETITLPLRTGYRYNLLVDWGDGSADSLITSFDDPDITHTFAAAGVQTITLMGTAEAWFFNNSGDRLKIYQVTELGDLNWKNFELAFNGCTNLTVVNGGVTDQVTNMHRMFNAATNATPDTSTWDTSAVTTMKHMFALTSNANPDTSGWDTSSVTDMDSMFANAVSANPNTTNWNTSNVTNMNNMFRNAVSATPNTTNWDTSKVTLMSRMFWGATNANPDTSNWNTSEVTAMFYMFYQATNANPNTSNWNTAKLTNTDNMFFMAVNANPNVSNWNTSQLTSATGMFQSATNANPDFSNWNFATITNMSNMVTGPSFSVTNYSNMLNRIIATSTQSNVNLNVGGAKYNVGAAAARATLVGNGWVITDGGPE